MKIVHVNTELPWGGGEVQTCYLVRGLEDRGVRNILVAQPGAKVAARARAGGIEVIELRMRGEWDILAVLRLSRILKQTSPDVLHLHTSHAHTLGLLAGRLAKVRNIVVTRRMARAITGAFSALKYRRADRIVAISEVVQAILIEAGIPERKIALIRSAIDCPEPYPPGDLRAELGLDSDTPVIGTVATLVEQKGHRCVFEAMRTVKARYPKVRLLVAGEGPLETELRTLAGTLGLEREILFLGFRKDVPKVLNTLDVFVLASLGEGLGVALLEAAWCGLPSVATNVGGVPEIVKEGSTGFLIAPGDSASLAERVTYLLEHPEQRRKLGGNAKTLVREKFSVETMVRRYCDLYRDLSGDAVTFEAARS